MLNPQSAGRMLRLTLTQELTDELRRLAKRKDGSTTLFKRILDSVRTIGSKSPFVTVSPRDVDQLRMLSKNPASVAWCTWARAVLTNNGIG